LTGALRSGEIDFAVKNRSGEIEYYQVSWGISNIETEKRELPSLAAIKDNYLKFLLLIESFTQNKVGIIHKNVFDWVLER
jgi:predicted AAA+ superfamily ATPase